MPTPSSPAGSLRLPRGVLAVAIGAFVLLSLAALFVDPLGADTVIREWLLAAASPNVIGIMRVVNVMGDWKFLVPATVLLIAVFDRARRTWWIWIAMMVAVPLIESLMKLTVGRARPGASSYGFPSGHAIAVAAYFGAVLYLAEALPRTPRAVLRIVAVVLMLLVAVARVMLRAHWPSDVLGGLALGLALASAATVLASRRLA